MHSGNVEDPASDAVSRKALALIADSILNMLSPNEDFLQEHRGRAQALFNEIFTLDDEKKKYVGLRIIHTVVATSNAILGGNLLGFLNLTTVEDSKSQQQETANTIWMLRDALKATKGLNDEADIFDRLYTTLRGLQVGEVSILARPGRRRARRAEPYQRAQIIWTASVIRSLLIQSVRPATEADKLFEKNFFYSWDTVRKRRSFCRKNLGSMDAGEIEHKLTTTFRRCPASEQTDMLLTELSRQSELYKACGHTSSGR